MEFPKKASFFQMAMEWVKELENFLIQTRVWRMKNSTLTSQVAFSFLKSIF